MVLLLWVLVLSPLSSRPSPDLNELSSSGAGPPLADQKREETQLMTRSQAAARVRSAPHRPSPSPAPSRPSGVLATERRRRERHYRLRRRDLLEDVGAGLLVTVLLLMLTAGLGVLALLDLALLALLVASGVVERRRRRHARRNALQQRREPVRRSPREGA